MSSKGKKGRVLPSFLQGVVPEKRDAPVKKKKPKKTAASDDELSDTEGKSKKGGTHKKSPRKAATPIVPNLGRSAADLVFKPAPGAGRSQSVSVRPAFPPAAKHHSDDEKMHDDDSDGGDAKPKKKAPPPKPNVLKPPPPAAAHGTGGGSSSGTNSSSGTGGSATSSVKAKLPTKPKPTPATAPAAGQGKKKKGKGSDDESGGISTAPKPRTKGKKKGSDDETNSDDEDEQGGWNGDDAFLNPTGPDGRPRCHYGKSCYRVNPQHRAEYYHQSTDEQTLVGGRIKRSKTKVNYKDDGGSGDEAGDSDGKKRRNGPRKDDLGEWGVGGGEGDSDEGSKKRKKKQGKKRKKGSDEDDDDMDDEYIPDEDERADARLAEQKAKKEMASLADHSDADGSGEDGDGSGKNKKKGGAASKPKVKPKPNPPQKKAKSSPASDGMDDDDVPKLLSKADSSASLPSVSSTATLSRSNSSQSNVFEKQLADQGLDRVSDNGFAADQSPSDDRPECPYGAGCYRKNPQHFKDMRHPEVDPVSKTPTTSKVVLKLEKPANPIEDKKKVAPKAAITAKATKDEPHRVMSFEEAEAAQDWSSMENSTLVSRMPSKLALEQKGNAKANDKSKSKDDGEWSIGVDTGESGSSQSSSASHSSQPGKKPTAKDRIKGVQTTLSFAKVNSKGQKVAEVTSAIMKKDKEEKAAASKPTAPTKTSTLSAPSPVTSLSKPKPVSATPTLAAPKAPSKSPVPLKHAPEPKPAEPSDDRLLSVFKGCEYFIHGKIDGNDAKFIQKWFVAYDGDKADEIGATTTHIITSGPWDKALARLLAENGLDDTALVVTPKWALDCIHQKKLLSETPYLLTPVPSKPVGSSTAQNDDATQAYD